MRYYLPRPVLGYLLLSLLLSVVFGSMVIGVCGIADAAVSDGGRAAILLGSFFLSALYFIGRSYYTRNHRTYVELGRGYIEWCICSRNKSRIERIEAGDINLFEIVYTEGGEQPWFYNVYGPARERLDVHGLELFPIPSQTILGWCKEQGIAPYTATIADSDIKEVAISNKKLKIVYHSKLWLFRERAKKIKFREIQSIHLASPHPVSKTEGYYVVTTHEGVQYTLSSRFMNREDLQEAMNVNGIQVVQQGRK